MIPNNEGLTTLTYLKGDKYFTYYFKDGGLYAGAYTKAWSYSSVNTDLTSAIHLYYMEKDNLGKKLDTTLPMGKIWRTPDNSTQIAHWDENDQTRSQALIWDYLELKTEARTALGRGSLDLYNYSSISRVIFEYILVSP